MPYASDPSRSRWIPIASTSPLITARHYSLVAGARPGRSARGRAARNARCLRRPECRARASRAMARDDFEHRRMTVATPCAGMTAPSWTALAPCPPTLTRSNTSSPVLPARRRMSAGSLSRLSAPPPSTTTETLALSLAARSARASAARKSAASAPASRISSASSPASALVKTGMPSCAAIPSAGNVRGKKRR